MTAAPAGVLSESRAPGQQLVYRRNEQLQTGPTVAPDQEGMELEEGGADSEHQVRWVGTGCGGVSGCALAERSLPACLLACLTSSRAGCMPLSASLPAIHPPLRRPSVPPSPHLPPSLPSSAAHPSIYLPTNERLSLYLSPPRSLLQPTDQHPTKQEMSKYEPFVMGMLTNFDALPLDRVHNMLKVRENGLQGRAV